MSLRLNPSRLSNRTQSVKPLLSNLYSSTLPIRREKLPRLSVERSRVAEAPRGPEAGRPSRPRRQRGIGAQAKSQLCRPTARHRRALVIGLGRAYARFTVVSAVGTRPPHDGHSGDRPSTVECAVQEGGNPERGMTSPTSPAGTSRSSGSTEHGDGQSPHRAYLTTELPGAGSQVPANVAALGLKSAPFFHIACMTTAILRATATAARLKPRRFLRAKPHRRRSLSPCTRVSMVVAAS
jgi:hypothetical protein